MLTSSYVDNSKPSTTLTPTRGVAPLDPTGHTNDRKLPIEKPNYPAEANAEAYEHQPDIPRHAPRGRETRVTAASPALRATALVVLAVILYVANAKPKNMFTLVNIFISMEAIFAYLLATFHNQRRAMAWSPRAAQPHAGHYHCATQRHPNTRLRIGTDGFIPRWTRGSTVKYIVRAESFPNRDVATYAAGKLAEAISMWKDKGVRFQQVYRTRKATFQVVYRDMPADDNPSICAEAFFPHSHSPTERTLSVYGLALEEDNRDYLANIFAHEIGHIMGLRHEFAGMSWSGEAGSVLWGEENNSSIMNYFDHLSKWRVQKQDLDDVRSFYEFTRGEYRGLMIREFEPPTFSYQ